VLGSIVLFSIVYLFLFAVWVYVLNRKIHDGPEEADMPTPTATGTEGLLEAAARLPAHGGYSLTTAKQETTPVREE
jgi:hypothetical protein